MKTFLGYPLLNGKINLKVCKPMLTSEELSFYESYKPVYLILLIIISLVFFKINKSDFYWIYPVYFLSVFILVLLYKYYSKILKWKVVKKGFIVRYNAFDYNKEHTIIWEEIDEIYLLDVFYSKLKDGLNMAYSTTTYDAIIIIFKKEHSTIRHKFYQSDFLVYSKDKLELHIKNINPNIRVIKKESISNLQSIL